MTTHQTRVGWSAAALCMAVLMSGCGSDDTPTAKDPASQTPEESPQSSPSESPTPSPSSTQGQAVSCDQAWTVGADLPQGYKGCADAEGTWVPADVVNCSVGNTLVLFDSTFYASPGHLIRKATPDYQNDAAYQQVYMICTG